jgi:hypothetical protein
MSQKENDGREAETESADVVMAGSFQAGTEGRSGAGPSAYRKELGMEQKKARKKVGAARHAARSEK